jgi:predicted unusual protein kinase regulating ubiquinone biosynthesis (AarF/ABC1/UbiB family)
LAKDRELTTGRWGRFARLSKLGARTTLSLLTSRDGAAAAERAAEVLGSLRGLAAKVGQMASYIDGIVPDEQRAAYRTALAALRAAAPSSSPDAIRKLVESELGTTIESRFASFQAEPFASASIGQVHRATLPDGRVVAVKVQHPGIDRAVESDLENASVIEGVMSMLGPRQLDASAVFDEVRARFREELDYRIEAERQARFAALFAGDSSIHVPFVVAELSTRRVLTTEFVGGVAIEAVSTADRAERRAYAETLWRFVFKSILVGGLFNADPHPGNFLFQGNGQVAFLDFGCVQPLADEQRKRAIKMHLAAGERDEAAFYEAAKTLLGTRGGSYERVAIGYARRCFEPVFASPFKLTSEYVTDVVRGIRGLKAEIFAKDKSFTMPPPGITFMNRLQFGFYSLLAMLEVEADYAAVERSILAEL